MARFFSLLYRLFFALVKVKKLATSSKSLLRVGWRLGDGLIPILGSVVIDRSKQAASGSKVVQWWCIEFCIRHCDTRGDLCVSLCLHLYLLLRR